MSELGSENIRDLTSAEDGVDFAKQDIDFINRSLRQSGLKEIPPNGLVLDLGCGEGSFVKGLQKAGYRAFGLDKADAIYLNEDELIQANLNEPKKVLSRLEDKDLRGKFDLITANALSDYVAGEMDSIQPEGMARVITESLNPDGIFYAPEVTLSILGERSIIKHLLDQGMVQLDTESERQTIFVKQQDG